MEHLLFSKDHLWIDVEGDIATVGITDYAADQMGEVTFVELPENGSFCNKYDVAATIEADSTETTVSCPITGEILEQNEILLDTPDAINNSPCEDGWLFKINIADENELNEFITHKEYQDYLTEEVL